MRPGLERRARSRQQLRSERLLHRYEMALTRALIEARDAFIGICATSAETGDRNFDGELIAYRVDLRLLLTQQFEAVIPVFGRAVLADIEAIATKAADDTFFSRLVAQWTRERLADAAGQIAGTTLADVLAVVEPAITAGLGSAEIGRRIRDVTRLSKFRSFTVARTETHMAASFAQAGTARQAEADFQIKLVKVWLPTLDSRTRDRHAAMSSHPPIPLDQKFNVGGVLMDRPGDPAGGASNVISCRCTVAHRLAPDNPTRT